ncbi:MAG: RNA-directed DNA polymerase [Lachnospiraceae bacterium]|nr:RNA-directed DNA polymerase [Lachnospiraceae bacterium]
MYNDIFLKMDIQNFFPSLNHRYLAESLFYEINKNTAISRTECYDIIRKCSVGNKGIPLGLVSSPALANLYMKEFDGLLYGKIKKMDLINPIYTRYADDMVISFKSEQDYEHKITEIQRIVKDLLKRVHLSINEKKTEVFNLGKSNHVRITGVSITIDENGYRHISVGKKLKNEIFWSAINQYDQKDRNDTEIAHIKGLFSFAMSIEKNGIEDCYSENMKALIKARGYNSLKELIRALEN